ncbi:MAG: NADH-quinone oxidoreductase subunit C [Chloroflexi bacterium AL-W]|nr:NADH-quinone oxidoreductase subunit C [Chloroflexi bacterium AL-N1]NOK64959.1 NADH-quinone oxidoreductase subunit C [Chloroflexi bacterium AL-N10]NOK76729.1 NADH-quinone oxidoreductase subunit C [Chloroflexi bacterium AL-N5]NOK84620.1 NADH-quinone oxidoreductase subunit C [Chloroflexi bacterium AL-W]NOK86555.1 NADH-quinone oxidoreductase subunit C [Chloroflexi bacterium AL-N15]
MDNATVVNRLQSTFSHAIEDMKEFRGLVNLHIKRDSIVDVAQFLRDDPELRYNFLENLCGVDYLGREPRFEVVYHMLSYQNRHRVCLKVGLLEDDLHMPSLTPLWQTANWQERETYDMFGIVFHGHPSLERILMPEDWVGHPLRKDVPLGDEEVAFTINEEQIYARKPFAKE